MAKAARILRVAGRILALLSLAFVVYRLWRLRPDFSVPGDALGWLPVLGAVYALSVSVSFLPWLLALRVTSGKRMPMGSVAVLSVRANLYKYLPGNVLQYVGRNELAVTQDIRHGEVAAATLCDMLAQLFAGCALGLILGAESLGRISALAGSQAPLLLLGVPLLVLTVFAVFFRKKRRDFLQAVKTRLTASNVRLAGLAIAFYLGTTLLTAALFVGTLTLFAPALPWERMPAFGGAFIVSWVGGYLVPGVPGGIGVREMLMTSLAPRGQEDAVLAAIVVFRAVSIFGDVLAFFVVRAVAACAARRKSDREG